MRTRKTIILLTIFMCGVAIFWGILYPDKASSGPYLDSTHGNTTYGVDRTSLSTFVYSKGNCAHCHEQHAMIGGAEPDPTGGPSVFDLFSNNFNNAAQTRPYSQSDNFCFYCHITSGGMQNGGGITNKPYSNTFGGYTINNATNIMGAFNLNSYHNLYDIQQFAKTKFAFFKDSSNPCVACHNPHLAKRNKTYPADPTYTAISRPTDHNNLWGDDAPNERMSKYTSYRSPYYYSSVTYEPNGSALNDGSLTPDYNTFCLDCHQYEVPTHSSASMNPNTTPNYLTAINWSASGDMHGEGLRFNNTDGSPQNSGTIIAPYNVVPVQSNYVLSCLDCHEPHGSIQISGAGRPSSYLLRKDVNGVRINACGGAESSFCESNFCYACHTTLTHCGGAQGCFPCHYHGAYANGGGWCGPWFGHVF